MAPVSKHQVRNDVVLDRDLPPATLGRGIHRGARRGSERQNLKSIFCSITWLAFALLSCGRRIREWGVHLEAGWPCCCFFPESHFPLSLDLQSPKFASTHLFWLGFRSENRNHLKHFRQEEAEHREPETYLSHKHLSLGICWQSYHPGSRGHSTLPFNNLVRGCWNITSL